MYYQLALLACVFYVTGTICLGGALFRVPQYDDKEVWSEIEFRSRVAANDAKEVAALRKETVSREDRIERRVDMSAADIGELHGKIDHLDKKYQGVADDFYRHLSLNAKKAKTRGHQ